MILEQTVSGFISAGFLLVPQLPTRVCERKSERPRRPPPFSPIDRREFLQHPPTALAEYTQKLPVGPVVFSPVAPLSPSTASKEEGLRRQEGKTGVAVDHFVQRELSHRCEARPRWPRDERE